MTGVGEMIHRKLCKKLKIDHTLQKQEYDLDNGKPKILWNF